MVGRIDMLGGGSEQEARDDDIDVDGPFPAPTDGTATTIRFTGVNVQIVNGLNATNGSPSNRSSVSPLLTQWR